jgi:HEPN domain-containing protein
VDLVIGDPNVAPWIIGFHCQQAAEKSLKAVLVRRGVHFRKIHDLFRLIQLFENTDVTLPEWSGYIDVLNPFAVEARYSTLLPDDFDPYEASRLAREVRDWARNEIEARTIWEGDVPEECDSEN